MLHSQILLLLVAVVFHKWTFCSAFQVAPRLDPVRISKLKWDPIRMSKPNNWKVKAQATPVLDESSSESVILAGTSPKAIRLRKQLQAIWTKPNVTTPVLIIGPIGSGKLIVAEEVVNRLPANQRETVHRLNMCDAVMYVDTILGLPNGTQLGLLDILANQENTTLILQTFKTRTTDCEADYEKREELRNCVENLIRRQVFYSKYEGREKPFKPRVIATCVRENGPDFLTDNPDLFLVKVPALESRNQDMEAIANAEIKILEKKYGLENVRLSPEAVQRLLDHSWEVCDEELVEELDNALDLLALERQRNPQAPNTLQPKHMLVNSLNEQSRRRLLYEFPALRKIIRSPWVFDHTLRYIVVPVFVATLAALFLGPQTREHNTALTYFWAGWWPAVMLSYPFLGRIWCSICPFMAIGTLAQEAVTNIGGVKLAKWPKWVKTDGSTFAFGLFFAILMWEELWELPENGVLSAMLLLLITSGAVFNSVQFENRAWCRYLCPIGAMCRVFGTMSMVEVRSWKANCEGCANPQCVKGDSPAADPSDTFAIKGCTMQLKNNQLRDMGDCTLCMSCVKNCERQVPEVNTRPIGLDYGLPWLLPPALQKQDHLALSQVDTNYWLGALLTILQGSVFVHYMPTILSDLGVDPTPAYAAPAFDEPFLFHSLITAGLLALPGLGALAADKASIPLEMIATTLQGKWEKLTKPNEQKVVIDLYDTIMKSDLSFAEIMKEFDPDGDGMISCWECKQALGHLNIPEDQCEMLMDSMKDHFGSDVKTKPWPIEAWLDYFQELYVNARDANNIDLSPVSIISRLQRPSNHLRTKKTFVEIFNDLDTDKDGFISEDEVKVFLDGDDWKRPLTDMEKLGFLKNAGPTDNFRLNLFQFMSMMRKIVRVGIQEIGYGYLPMAWASLTAYWLGIGMSELGLSVARLPDTFFMDQPSTALPQISAGIEIIEPLQALLVLGAIPISIGLTQKLCADNKIGGIRFGLHAIIQILIAAEMLHLMLPLNSNSLLPWMS